MTTAFVQYPQLAQSYQPIATPQPRETSIAIAPNANDNNFQNNKKNYDVNFRLNFGPDVSLDMEGLGYSREQEIARTTSLNGMINPSFFQEDSYSGPFFAAIKANNAVYRATYQVFFAFLAFIAGIFISFAMALLMATTEFMNQFIFRPLFRMIRIYVGFGTFFSQVTYECLRPLMALFLPWNKQ